MRLSHFFLLIGEITNVSYIDEVIRQENLGSSNSPNNIY